MSKSFAAHAAAVCVLAAGAAAQIFAAPCAQAQGAPIERTKLTDAELSCAQIYAESGQMDKVAADARAAQEKGNNTATAGTVGNVAAEVAGRTGLFGQLGGVAGSLFGKLAAQTAANTVQQSGQSDAQLAAERARQAGARKEYLAALFTNKGCKASDLAYNPPTQPAMVQAALQATAPAAGGAGGAAGGAVGGITAGGTTAAPAATTAALLQKPAVSALPDADPDAFFKGKTGGTFGKDITEVLPGNRRVAVAGFRVAFITRNTAHAQVRASYLPGRDTSGASSTLVLNLSGVDTAAMQALTDRAYADFLAQLRLAGREVLSPDELKEFLAGVEVTPSSPAKPYVKEANNQTAMVFAPAGMPLWFHNWDGHWADKSPFEQKNIRAVAEYSKKLNAIVIAPLIVVNFARMQSSGNQSGLVASSAETGATLRMAVVAFTSHVVRSDESRDGLVMKGDEGSVALQNAAFASELPFGEMREISSDDNKEIKGAFDALGKAMGMANAGGAARSKKEAVAETSNPQYVAAASDALVRATGTFARLFQKYPPSGAATASR
ncbi:MAG TPA: hypothetical protein VN667_12345 [Burkholderiales bacterium]|nr:hypothetical protein [Burkholderiales bacterium]